MGRLSKAIIGLFGVFFLGLALVAVAVTVLYVL